MRREVITKCFIVYLNNGTECIKTFQSEALMDRWTTRFLSDTDGDEDSYVMYRVIGFKDIKMEENCGIRVYRG